MAEPQMEASGKEEKSIPGQRIRENFAGSVKQKGWEKGFQHRNGDCDMNDLNEEEDPIAAGSEDPRVNMKTGGAKAQRKAEKRGIKYKNGPTGQRQFSLKADLEAGFPTPSTCWKHAPPSNENVQVRVRRDHPLAHLITINNPNW